LPDHFREREESWKLTKSLMAFVMGVVGAVRCRDLLGRAQIRGLPFAHDLHRISTETSHPRLTRRLDGQLNVDQVTASLRNAPEFAGEVEGTGVRGSGAGLSSEGQEPGAPRSVRRFSPIAFPGALPLTERRARDSDKLPNFATQSSRSEESSSESRLFNAKKQKSGRGGRIRTADPLTPSQVR
jgi:hypothetical protein